jgi:hypothetical protein
MNMQDIERKTVSESSVITDELRKLNITLQSILQRVANVEKNEASGFAPIRADSA